MQICHSSNECLELLRAQRNTYQGQEWVTTPVGIRVGKGVHKKYMAVTKNMTWQYMNKDLVENINVTKKHITYRHKTTCMDKLGLGW